MSLRTLAGALVYDVPRFAWATATGHWERMRNRSDRVTIRGRSVRCDWKNGTDLHIATVFPSAGRRLMRAAFAQWPIVIRDAPEQTSQAPVVTFVIGHRGMDRLPNLLATLRSIAGQQSVAFECIVVELAAERVVEGLLPPWVRYRFVESHEDYNRAATFNAGAEIARGEMLILHDNDLVVPAGYAAAVMERRRAGGEFIDLKRFVFYLEPSDTARFIAGDPARGAITVTENLVGGSIAAAADSYRTIGGFDEEFVGWGGEDNEFWERAEAASNVDRFGELPMIHLYHAPQRGKLEGRDAPAVKRYRALEGVPPADRIRRLRERRR